MNDDTWHSCLSHFMPQSSIEYFDDRFAGLRKQIEVELDLFANRRGKRLGRSSAESEGRFVPCQVCDFPFSDRHHILDVSSFGENRAIVRLCPNCHALYHMLVEGTYEAIADKFPSRQFEGVSYLYCLARSINYVSFAELIDISGSEVTVRLIKPSKFFVLEEGECVQVSVEIEHKEDS